MKNKSNKSRVFWVGLTETNGQYKFHDALLEVPLNQYCRGLKRVNSRNLARKVNRKKLVIK